MQMPGVAPADQTAADGRPMVAPTAIVGTKIIFVGASIARPFFMVFSAPSGRDTAIFYRHNVKTPLKCLPLEGKVSAQADG